MGVRADHAKNKYHDGEARGNSTRRMMKELSDPAILDDTGQDDVGAIT